jgi:tetratricopeptide (TPR) repeat protein
MGRKTKRAKRKPAGSEAEALGRRAAAMLCAGDVDGAVRTAREALGRDGKCARAHAVQGRVDADNGRLEKALRHLTEARRAGDRQSETLRVLGHVYRSLERWDDAADAFRAQADAASEDVDAWFNHARSLVDAGRLDESVASWRRVLELAPGDADACTNLGGTLWQLGQREAAVLELEAGLERTPGHATITNKLRDALAVAGNEQLNARNAPGARAMLERALDLGSEHARVHTDLAAALTATGELELAATHHRRALELDPKLAHSWYALARAGQLDDPAPLEHLLADGSLPADEAAHVLYALGEVHERARRFEPAYRAFARANETQARATAPYDPRTFDQRVDELIEAFPVERFSVSPGPAGEHVLVVGMPRSGTTLVEGLLDAHPAVSGRGERTELARLVTALPGATVAQKLTAFDENGARSFGAAYKQALGPREGGVQRVVDKLPLNLLHIGWAALALPGLRILHCRRDARDTALSCWTQNFERADYAVAHHLPHLAALHASCERLMVHWVRALPRQVLAVDYETLVRNPARSARRLTAFLDLPWSESCLDFHRSQEPVYTASAQQVRRPIYTSSIGRWLDYEPWAFAD